MAVGGDLHGELPCFWGDGSSLARKQLAVIRGYTCMALRKSTRVFTLEAIRLLIATVISLLALTLTISVTPARGADLG